MSTSFRFFAIPAVAAAAAALLFVAAAPVQAATSNSASYDQYRRVVLGDSTVAAPVAQAAAAGGLVQVPGAYAQYLIQTGMSKDVAVASARRIGEAPDYRWAATEAAVQPLNGVAAHEKYLGNPNYATFDKNSTANSAE